MNGIMLSLSGKYGHFKRPETCNNPCTYSYMHKCGFIGLMGAVLGIERTEMVEITPRLCDDLLYGIQVINPVIKDAVGFTKRKSTSSSFFGAGRRFQEVIKNPSYKIFLALANTRSEKLFEEFTELLKSNRSRYPVYFGIASCPCNFKNVTSIEVSEKLSGTVELSTVFSSKHSMESIPENTELIFERVPTHQIDSLYTVDKMVETVCPSVPIMVSGEYYTVNGELPIWMM